jgi:hypothetical protein
VRERRFTGREIDVYAEGVMPPPEADVAATEAADEAAPPELDPRNEGIEEVLEAETPEAEADAAAAAEAPDAEAPATDPAVAEEDTAGPAVAEEDTADPESAEDGTGSADERGA